jgi:capsid assembly protease
MPLGFAKPTERPALIAPPVAAPAAVAPTTTSAPKRKRASIAAMADRLFNHPWLIAPRAGDALVAEFVSKMHAGWDDDEDEDEDDFDYPVTEDGIACLAISGALTADKSWRGTAYSEIMDACKACADNPAVKSILMVCDSPGGEACSDMFETAEYMRQLAAAKPMAAISKDSCYSAAYCLCCAANKVFVTSVGGVGSIGVWQAHVDISEALKQMGVKVTLIQSGDRKTFGNQFEPLAGEAKDEMQAECDRIRDMFVQAVAKARGVSADALYDTEAACFMADAGIPLVCDQVGTVADAMAYLRARMAEAPADDDTEDDNEDKDGIFGQAASAFTEALGRSAAQILSEMELRGASGHANGVALLGGIHAGAIPARDTSTSDAAWDGPANVARLKDDQPASYYRQMFAWVDPKKDATKKDSYKYPIAFVSDTGSIGAASVVACEELIGRLNGNGAGIPSADRKGVWNHAAAHLRKAGKEPAPLKSMAEVRAEASRVTLELPDGGSFVTVGGVPTAENTSKAFVLDTPLRRRANSLLSGLSRLKRQYPDAIAAVRSVKMDASAAGEGESRRISILAAPYDGSSANLGEFKEVYRPGCFRDGLRYGDVRVLYNHSETQSQVLGRVSAGTAKVWEDPMRGVCAWADAPKAQWADDLLVSIRRGDITGASCGFWILEQSWDQRADGRYRIVEKALLHDVSVESYGAYNNATSRVASQASNERARKRLELARKRIL